MFGKREGPVGSYLILLNFKLLCRLPLGNIFKLGLSLSVPVCLRYAVSSVVTS